MKYVIDTYYNSDYTLSFYDTLSEKTIEIENKISEIIEYIPTIFNLISKTEHTFAHWIGINSWVHSYVIAIDVSRGNLQTNSAYHFNKETRTLTETFHLNL